MKQTYLQKAEDTYFNQVMFQANQHERHTVAGVAGPTKLRKRNDKGEEMPFRQITKSSSRKNIGEKVGTINKKSINPKKLNSARKQTAPVASRDVK